jgi:hypothetical protein
MIDIGTIFKVKLQNQELKEQFHMFLICILKIKKD